MKKDRKKISLGTETKNGYEFSSKIDLGGNEDFIDQIERLEIEREIQEKLTEKCEEIKIVIKKHVKKKKSIKYYYNVGKVLQFFDKKPFNKVKEYSLFRRIYELLPGVLPHIEEKTVAPKHIASMYYLGKVDGNNINRATWEQWYEILKFKEVYKNKDVLNKILKECEKGLYDINLRNRIKEIIEMKKRGNIK